MDPRGEPPPSSQTPLAFETAIEPLSGTPSRPARPRVSRTRPSLGHRLAPVAVLPVLFAALGLLWRSAPASSLRPAGGTGLAQAQTALEPMALRSPIPPASAAASAAAAVVAPEDDALEGLTLCPQGMALVVRDGVRVCVDRWEASIVELLPSGERRPHSPYVTPRARAGVKLLAVSLPAVVPQAYVTRHQAALACKNAGKRLCTGNEWRTACEGPQKTTWPYGDAEDRTACNTRGKNPLRILLGSSKTFMWGTAMQHPRLNTFPGTLAKTGAFERCTNDFGVHDMVGNLHEWTADGDFRGGYYRDDHVNAPGCRYRTTAHHGGYSDYSTGFRCCADPS